MPNINRLQLETKVSLVIIAIVIAILLFVLYKGLINFNKAIDKINIQYEELREPWLIFILMLKLISNDK